jgi:hypothetical protein
MTNRSILRKIPVVLLSMLIVYLGTYVFLLTKARWPFISHTDSCATQKSDDPKVIHKACEAGEQTAIKDVQVMFKRLPGELQAGKSDSIFLGQATSSEQLKKVLPAHSRIFMDTGSWKRSGSVSDVTIKSVSPGVLPKIEYYRATVAKGDDKVWKLLDTLPLATAKSMGLDK